MILMEDPFEIRPVGVFRRRSGAAHVGALSRDALHCICRRIDFGMILMDLIYYPVFAYSS